MYLQLDDSSVSSEFITHIFERCAGVLDSVISFSLNLSLVLLLVKLASVETVPNVVHLMVEFV